MRKFLKVVLVLAVLDGILVYVSRRASRRESFGDDVSPEFRRVSLLGGEEFVSEAPALRHGEAKVRGGGILIDLRNAGLDPDGAEIDVDVTLGGAMLIVPSGWAVEVREDAELGGVDVDLPSEPPPPGAPKLTVNAHARLGGISVKAG